jgi:hypothetical protein
MFNRIRFSVFMAITMLTMLIICVVSAFAQATAAAPVPDPLVLKLPAWMQAVLGLGSTAMGAALITWLKNKGTFTKLFSVVNDLKLFISAIIEAANVIKADIKSPEAVQAWNDLMTNGAKILNDTGNKSLMQKATFLQSKIIKS